MQNENKRLSRTTKRILTIVLLVLGGGTLIAISLLLLPHLIALVSNLDSFKAWVKENRLVSGLAMIGIMILKVILPIIPGKPFEIGAGYAFGVVEGTILCLIGTALGSYLVFIIVRTVGVKALNVFYSREKLLSLNFLKDTQRLSVWVFFIMLIPGTPKDLISFFVGLTNIKFSRWLIISPLARIPVIVMSTVGGDAIGRQEYGFAIIVFTVTLAISIIGLLVYRKIRAHKNKTNQETT